MKRKILTVILMLTFLLTGCNKNASVYPLEFHPVDHVALENLQIDGTIDIINEKTIDNSLSTFIFKDNQDSEYKAGIQMNGTSYYLGQVSMANTPDGLMGIEEVQVFGKKAVKIYGVLGANYALAYYWVVDGEILENSVIQVDGNTMELDLDNDDKNEIISTLSTIPETRIYILKEGKVYASDINQDIGAEAVVLKDENKKIFEAYFEPNKPQYYVFQKEVFIKR